MNNQDPTPASPAAVCERLSFILRTCGTHTKLHKDVTAALLLIEQGEKERERLDLLQERLIPWGDEGGYEINFAASSTDLRKECDEVLAVQKAARAQPTPESK